VRSAEQHGDHQHPKIATICAECYSPITSSFPAEMFAIGSDTSPIGITSANIGRGAGVVVRNRESPGRTEDRRFIDEDIAVGLFGDFNADIDPFVHGLTADIVRHR